MLKVTQAVSWYYFITSSTPGSLKAGIVIKENFLMGIFCPFLTTFSKWQLYGNACCHNVTTLFMKGAFWGEKIVETVDSKRVHFYVSLALHAPVVFFSLVFLFIWLGITRSTATRQSTVVFYFISPIDTRFMAEYINSKWYSPSCLLVDPWLQDLSTIIDVWVLFFHVCILTIC